MYDGRFHLRQTMIYLQLTASFKTKMDSLVS